MDNRTLLALSQQLQGRPPAEVDEALRHRQLDPQDRLAVKVELATGARQGHTVRAAAHDQAATAMDRLLARVGIDGQRTYTEAELNALLAQAGLDTEQRLACKIECQARHITRQASVVDRVIINLGIDAPLTLTALEQRLDEHGIGSVAMRVAVRAELQQRGLLDLRARTLRASADVRRRKGLTLRSQPE